MEGIIVSKDIDSPQKDMEVFYTGEHSPEPHKDFPFKKYQITKVFTHRFFDLEILKRELGYPSVIFSANETELKQIIVEYEENGHTKKIPIHHEQENMAMMIRGEKVGFKILYKTVVDGKIYYFENSNGQSEPVAKIILSEM